MAADVTMLLGVLPYREQPRPYQQDDGTGMSPTVLHAYADAVGNYGDFIWHPKGSVHIFGDLMLADMPNGEQFVLMRLPAAAIEELVERMGGR